jgi:D-3-phosphoglycerate dehydrogenase
MSDLAFLQAVHVDGAHFPPHRDAPEMFRAAGVEFVWAPCRTGEDLLENTRRAHAVLTCGVRLGASVISRMEKCRVIARYGAGTDAIDLDAATQSGIVVVNTPHYSVDEVSNHTLTLMLSLARHLKFLDQAVSRGEWSLRRERPIRRLRGSTLGVIGLGNIGSAVASKAKALGMRVITLDRVTSEVASRHGFERVGFDELLRRSDVVSLHVQLTDATRRLIGARELALMKQTAILINTARGPVVDEGALIAALREKVITGAGLDVFDPEPPCSDNPLLQMDNVICTPHTASHSVEALEDQHMGAIQQVLDVLAGRQPEHAVNPSVCLKVSPNRERS